MELKEVRGLEVVWKEQLKPKGKTEPKPFTLFTVRNVIEKDGNVLFRVEKKRSIPNIHHLEMKKYKVGFIAGKLLEDGATVAFYRRKKIQKGSDGWLFLNSFKYLDADDTGNRIHYTRLITLSREWLMEKAKTVKLMGVGEESITLQMPEEK